MPRVAKRVWSDSHVCEQQARQETSFVSVGVRCGVVQSPDQHMADRHC
jgi:hypothetical protein